MEHESQFPSPSPAPAVTKAIQILDYLANTKPEAGVTEIASAIDINKSTCFNILRTLAFESMVIKDSRYPVYRLGPRLVELGTASRRNFSNRRQIIGMVRPLVDSIDISCIISQPIPSDRGFVVVDRVTSSRSEAFSAPIGHFYPITAPAMGRALLAYRDIDEVLWNVRNQPDGPKDEDVLALVDSLSAVRAKGFGWSTTEHQAGTNAVAVPVLDENREAVAILCLVGRTEQFPASKIDEYGAKLKSLAEDIESAISHDQSRR